MTVPDRQADEVRRRYPDWVIWRLVDCWWAKRVTSDVAARAADLTQLTHLIDEIDEQEQAIVALTSQP